MSSPSNCLLLGGLVVALASLTPARAQAQGQDGLDKQLERHPFFSKVTSRWVERRPFLFLVQQPAAEDPAYAARVADEYVALMQPVRASFEERYVEPYGLESRAPVHVIAILASAADFDTYLDASEASLHVDVRATQDPVTGITVVHEVPAQAERAPAERTRSARHAMAHVMQNAYYGGKGGYPASWVFEGVAAYMAGLAPDGASRGPDPETVRQLVTAGCDPQRRWESIRTLAELGTVSNGRRLVSWLRVEAQQRELPAADTLRAWTSFNHQAALLVRYMQEGDDFKYAQEFETFWQAALSGKRDMEALATAFPRETLAEIDAGFLEWLALEHQRLWPRTPFDAQVLMDAVAWGESPAPTAASAASAAKIVSAGLAFADATPEERLALAIWEVRSGRASLGLAALEELVAEQQAGELTARIERELQRVAAWIELRDAFLRKCLDEEIQLQFEYRGKRSKTLIESLEEGAILLAPNRLGVARLEIESLAPVELARQMSRLIDELGEDWVRIYPYVLQEDSKWKRFLKGKDESSQALRQDAEESYPALFRTARAAQLLISIQALPEMRGPAEAQAELAALRGLCTEYGDVDLVDRRRAALRGRAEEVAGTYFDLVRPWKALAGELEELGDGRVALVYDFSDPQQLLDFQDHPYLTSHGKKFGELQTEEAHGFRVADGMLRGIGNACLRSLVDLETPLTVTYELSFEDVEGLQLPLWYMNVGICDDGLGHFAWAMNIDYLEVWHREETESAYPTENSALYMDEFYTVELRNDGKLVELFCEKDKKQELPCRSRRKGATFLWSYTDFPVRIRALRIEGQTSASSFERLKRAWIARQLADL